MKKVKIFVTYSLEKEIHADLPQSSIEYEDDYSVFIDQSYLDQIYRDNGIDPATVEDQDWEIKP